MKTLSNKIAAISLAALISAPVFAQAPVVDATVGHVSNAELAKRLDDLSRVIDVRNRMQQRFQTQLDDLAQEVREMKGSMELFENQLSQVEDRQRTLFQMLDEQRQQIANSNKATVPVVTPPMAATSGAVASASNGDDKVQYQAAVDLVLTDKQYEQAIVAFQSFVKTYPESSYVPNAYYWLGQLLYKEKQRDQARAAFLEVTEKYPDSNKRADALFKIGIIDEYAGQLDSAKSFYQKVISEYPETSAAGLAEKRLKGL